MFKGILKFLSGNKFKAFLIFRECWKTYKKYEHFISKPDNECKENAQKATKDPLWLDADFKSRLLLGLGLFYLGISALPRSLTAIIRIVGFAGNRDKGKMYL